MIAARRVTTLLVMPLHKKPLCLHFPSNAKPLCKFFFNLFFAKVTIVVVVVVIVVNGIVKYCQLLLELTQPQTGK